MAASRYSRHTMAASSEATARSGGRLAPEPSLSWLCRPALRGDGGCRGPASPFLEALGRQVREAWPCLAGFGPQARPIGLLLGSLRTKGTNLQRLTASPVGPRGPAPGHRQPPSPRPRPSALTSAVPALCPASHLLCLGSSWNRPACGGSRPRSEGNPPCPFLRLAWPTDAHRHPRRHPV